MNQPVIHFNQRAKEFRKATSLEVTKSFAWPSVPTCWCSTVSTSQTLHT
ncbi:hypothetical protein IHE45_01G076400 [Dioscorea alata]|uniref:Uncharacterized protein n=1 Tax=Dioscorea alata TaxID=55571 RepID=A0ACB7WW25_DIOAL|nr:hypothetical protein IHE45_01G076400 [Dioscorea alata]